MNVNDFAGEMIAFYDYKRATWDGTCVEFTKVIGEGTFYNYKCVISQSPYPPGKIGRKLLLAKTNYQH